MGIMKMYLAKQVVLTFGALVVLSACSFKPSEKYVYVISINSTAITCNEIEYQSSGYVLRNCSRFDTLESVPDIFGATNFMQVKVN